MKRFEFNRVHRYLCVGLTLERMPVTDWVKDSRLPGYGVKGKISRQENAY